MTPLSHRYVSGNGFSDANPKQLPFTTFSSFVLEWLSVPVVCHLKAADYATLSPTEQKSAKSTSYFCAGIFGGDGRRRITNVAACHLLVLDVDDAASARALLAAPLADLIPWNFALWHTLTSTPAAPRLRLVIDTEPLNTQEYRTGVRWMTLRLGIENLDPVSGDPSHLWYRPTVFSDLSNQTPIIASRTVGSPLTCAEWCGFGPSVEEDTDVPEIPSEDILNLPVSGITLEDAREMLTFLNPDDPPYWGWVKPLMALKHQFLGSEEALEAFIEWSATGSKFAGRASTAAKWRSFRANPPNRDPVTIRSLIDMAVKKGYKSNASASARAALALKIYSTTDPFELVGPTVEEILRTPGLSEADLGVLIDMLRARGKVLGVSIRASDLRKRYGRGACETKSRFGKRNRDGGPCNNPTSSMVPAPMQGFVFITEMNKWLHPTKDVSMSQQAFDTAFSDECPEKGLRATRHAIDVLGMPIAHRLGYEPRNPDQLFYVDETGTTCLNTYRKSYPEEDPLTAPEAAAIWEKHLALLFPHSRDVDMLQSWMTWCLRNPGEKARWHIFIQGAPGCGKSMIAEALRMCFGPTNSRKVSNTMVTEKFNLWAQSCLFAYFEEITLAERHRDVMEQIKDFVTGEVISIRAMHRDTQERRNMVNGMFLSNHLHGLRIDRDDRRFFCLCCRQQTLKQVQDIEREHFQQLYRLQTDLAGGLRHYLLTRPLAEGFDPYGHAPNNPDRDIIFRAGATEIDCAINQLIDDPNELLVAADLLTGNRVIPHVKHELRFATSNQINKVLIAIGFIRNGQRKAADGETHTLWYHPDKFPEGAIPVEEFNRRLALEDVL